MSHHVSLTYGVSSFISFLLNSNRYDAANLGLLSCHFTHLSIQIHLNSRIYSVYQASNLSFFEINFCANHWVLSILHHLRHLKHAEAPCYFVDLHFLHGFDVKPLLVAQTFFKTFFSRERKKVEREMHFLLLLFSLSWKSLSLLI